MIAVCAEHHKKADAGSFPPEHLRKLKSGSELPSVSGRFDWLLRDFVVVMGGAFAAQTWVPLAFADRPLISFHRDEAGFLLMNIDMPTMSVAPRLRMWESTWYERGAPKDLECPPNGRLLRIGYKNGDYLRIEFRSAQTPEQFAARYPGFRDLRPSQVTYPLTLIEIELRIIEADLLINKDVFRVGGTEFKNTLVEGGNYFIGIGSHEPISKLTNNIGYSKKRFAPPLRLASQNDSELIQIDGVTIERRVLGLDGFAFENCIFKDSRLMFSGKAFSLRSCSFPGSALVLTDEAVTTCQLLENLRQSAGFDVATVLQTLATSRE